MEKFDLDFVNQKKKKKKQVIYFKQRRVMEYNKQKTLEKLRNEGVKGVPPKDGDGDTQGKPT